MKLSLTGFILGLVVIAFMFSCSSPAPAKVEEELRPSQIAMRDRAGWMKSMNSSFQAGDYGAVAEVAQKMSDQTRNIALNLQNQEAKLLTLKIGIYADEIVYEAGMENEEIVKARLASIGAVCSECHQKFR